MKKTISSQAIKLGQKKFNELTIKDLVILEFFKEAIDKSKSELSREEVQSLLVRCSQLADEYLEHCCIFKEK
jgi:hypothetical protein